MCCRRKVVHKPCIGCRLMAWYVGFIVVSPSDFLWQGVVVVVEWWWGVVAACGVNQCTVEFASREDGVLCCVSRLHTFSHTRPFLSGCTTLTPFRVAFAHSILVFLSRH
jgi:hypothetical protein